MLTRKPQILTNLNRKPTFLTNFDLQKQNVYFRTKMLTNFYIKNQNFDKFNKFLFENQSFVIKIKNINLKNPKFDQFRPSTKIMINFDVKKP